MTGRGNWDEMLQRAIATYNESPEGAIAVAAWFTRQWARFEQKPQLIPEFQQFLCRFWQATHGLGDIIRGLFYRAANKLKEYLAAVEQERQRWILWQRHSRQKLKREH